MHVAGLLLCAAGIALLCGMDAVAKSLGPYLSTFEIAFVRYAGAALWLALYLALTRSAWPQRRNFGRHALRGAMMVVTAFLFFFVITNLPLAIMTALAMSAPIYVSIFGIVFLKERPTRSLGIAIALGIVGSLIIVFGGAPIVATNASNLLVWIAAILAPMAYAVAVVLMKHHADDESAASMTFAQSVVAAILALPFAAVGATLPDPAIWPNIALVGLLGALGFILLINGLKRVPASAFAVVDYTSLLWAAFYGYVFFSEMPEPRLWIGGGLIIAACAVGMRATAKAAAETAPERP